MNRRPVSTLFAALLLIAQLMVAPFVHAEVSPTGDAGCAGMSHGGVQAGAELGASDCAQMAIDASGHCRQSGHHCRTHAACSCPCAHTPALATVRPLLLGPTPPSEVVIALPAPAIDPPPTELLRPPK